MIGENQNSSVHVSFSWLEISVRATGFSFGLNPFGANHRYCPKCDLLEVAFTFHSFDWKPGNEIKQDCIYGAGHGRN